MLGDSGDNGPAVKAQLYCPYDVFAHSDGSVFIADSCNSRIKKVGTDGVIHSIVGNGTPGYNGDNRIPTTALLQYPESLYVDSTGTKLYVSDTQNYRIRLVTLVPPSVPQAPTMDEVQVGNHEALVSFAAPTYDGGSPITGYTVYSLPSGGVDTNAGSTSHTHRMSGLVNGTSYTFVAKARNALGMSGPSLKSVAVVPLGVPGSPSITASTGGYQSVTVDFTPPSDVGSSPITGYQVLVSPAAGIDAQEGSTSLSHVISGLASDVAYTFSVRATNSVGTGLPSIASAPTSPAAVPGPVGSPQAQAGDRQVTLSWTPPSDWGASSPTGYRVTAYPGGATLDVPDINSTSAIFSNVQNGVSYTFSIQATSNLGLGAAATTNAVLPQPLLTVNDTGLSEGDSGTKLMTFYVTLSQPTTVPVSYNLRTIAGSATAGVDFVSVPSFRQTIPAGQTTGTLSVTINGDTTIEPDELFYVDAQQINGATVRKNVATGRIVNDDTPVLSIADVSTSEGNAGTKVLSFTIKLDKPATSPVSYNLRTIAGSATAGVDFVAVPSFRQTIPAGQSSGTLSVTINGDTTIENDEVFYVDAQQISGAAIGDNTAIGKIVNDDFPKLSIGDASVAEGNAGTKVLSFPITLSQAAIVPASFNVRTIAGSATADSDYVSVPSFRMTIPAGQSSATLSVTINGDTQVEGDEVFYVDAQQLSGAAVGDNVATGTILNDDVAGPTLSINDVSVAEGNSLTRQATFTVTLSQAAAADVTYTLSTADGTATAPGDYTAKTLAGITIPAGTTSKTWSVPVKGDTLVEPNETFFVNITNVVGAALADGQGVGTIINDDGATLSVARFDAGGLYDDIDDGHREPQLSTQDYALLLQDAAATLCRRANGVDIVTVDDVETRGVLADLAEAAKLACADKPSYAAVMAEGDSRGFLVQPSVVVLGKPRVDAQAKLSTLQVQGATGAITLVLPQALSANPQARQAQLQALGSRVQATLKGDAQARLVLIGGVTVPGLVDLTQRSLPTNAKLPAERVLVSPALLQEFGASKVLFPVVPARDGPAQVLELHQ